MKKTKRKKKHNSYKMYSKEIKIIWSTSLLVFVPYGQWQVWPTSNQAEE